ncbi:MAG: penicillin-binding protein [Actinobacteria bacterium]|nr:penicillin-binding protein [Actinomycetota bacterium]NDH13231.1 penicillin-binding protein [Actinomycetota bacterium]
MADIRNKFFRLGLILGGFIFVVGATVFGIAYFTVHIPDPNSYVNSQATIIQYADGSEIGRIGAQNRTIVPLANIPMQLRRAVLAAEDKNFYSNRAFSITGIVRAAFNNLRGGSLQGGSTITQQYAKTAFLTPNRDIKRKLKELIIAIKLENQFSKDQILENYLNTIYFGRGAYGVETGAQLYFGRSANQLTLEQSAILASILRSPGYYDPDYREGNLERLQARFKYVIDNMHNEGWISDKRYANIKFPEVKGRVRSGALAGPKGYLMQAVQSELNALGFTDDQLMIGGLVVKTTLEKLAQQAAVDAVDKESPAKAPDNLHIGMVSIRPGTGEIVAMYGGKDYLVRQLNDATQSIAQAGSTFKPFALIAALQAGISLSSIWNGDSPKVFDDAGKPYEVSNYGDKSFGDLPLLKATASSVNTIYVPLGIKAGLDSVVNAARAAGIPQSVALMPTPSIVLGVASPHVIDVASAFATFAAQGVYAKPFLVKEVQGSNKGVLYEATIQPQEVFDKSVMADLTYALSEVTRAGTATAAVSKLGRVSAGKTGTSQNNASAWFSGYVPQLATSIAFFRDDATQSLNGIGGLTSLTGGSFPARIWTAYMKAVLKDIPEEAFPEPAYIGGTTPAPIADPVPTLPPLEPTPSPTPSPKPTAKPTKKP